MKDLTKDSITRHILTTAVPVALSMLALIAYQLIDLYFVTRIGVAATAGVSAAGNAMFVFNALAQVLAVGTVTLVAHAMGRRDDSDADAVFNQSMLLAFVCGGVTAALFVGFMKPYLRSVAADEATIEAGASFMRWVLPGCALTLPFGVLSSTLRGTGVVWPSIAAYLLTVFINALLAPVLIAGWGTDVALGVRGAGLATSISIGVGTLFLAIYFHRLQRTMAMHPGRMLPNPAQWRRILTIGVPAGGEFALMFLSTAITYYAISDLGAEAQAGFGIGSRVLQAILLPGMAIAAAVAPIVGQNFGALNGERVKETFYKASLITSALMLVTTALLQWRPMALLGLFDAQPATIAIAAGFLQTMSWSLVAQGYVSTSAAIFQGLGNTLPLLFSSTVRFAALTIPVVWFSLQPSFHIEQLWYFAATAVLLQSLTNAWLLRAEFRRRLSPITVSVNMRARSNA